MHAIFMPYGHKQWVDQFLRDMAAQKYQLLFTSPDGKKTKKIWIEGQLRILPFGIYEHVFPREYLELVLTTLNFHKETYNLGKTKLKILRRMLKAKKAPKFKPKEILFWIKKFVSIIPLGIREDADMIEPQGKYKGWTHEAL